MALCSNCYDGCAEIVSDKCVKYTGIDIPILEIQKGDSLSYVTQSLVTFLTSTLNGSGIIITLEDEDEYCELISQYLQECTDVSALDLFRALVKAVCNLQEQVDAIVEDIATIEADYTVDCLEDVEAGDGTHAIVQAIITKLCEIDTNLTALALDVETNYVKLSDLNDLIAAYLEEQQVLNKAYTKMIPYAPIPYYGSLSNYPTTGDSFDASGSGLNYWENVYLCNGDNGTPDLRGRAPIGATSTPGLIAMDSAVNPAISGNPVYSIGDLNGANTETLDTTQIPAHTHTKTLTDPGHYTRIKVSPADDNEWSQSGGTGRPVVGVENRIYNTASAQEVATTTQLEVTGISLDIDNTGGGLAHANVQPGIGLYFIIYIPA